ncbi:hypothetical protein Hanom_Chr13g01208801 [Helianthus anomalus]
MKKKKQKKLSIHIISTPATVNCTQIYVNLKLSIHKQEELTRSKLWRTKFIWLSPTHSDIFQTNNL